MRSFVLFFTIAALCFSTSVFVNKVFAENFSPPQKIISINICLDGLLMQLVGYSRIDSLYYLSANPQFSAFAAQAQEFHLHHGLAEDIVPRNPDLIVSGEYTSAELMLLLKQLGLRVEIFALPRTLNDIAAHIRAFGALVGNSLAAEKMATTLEQKLASLDAEPKNTLPIPAFWYSSNGVVIGGDTLENELMTRAGFHNLALDKHISGFKQIDLEDLILAQPKVLIIDAADFQAFSLAREYIQHPALRAHQVKIIRLPTTVTCIAPVAADVIEYLSQQKKLL
jgi:iron complex transport system substrate-binding protein